jgi:hypothetical protein
MAHATHLQQDESHCVAIGALRVLITQDDSELWSAQGVEIDFSACGASLEDVQRRFENGLRGTIRANLDKFGGIERLLKWAPSEEIAHLSQSASGYDLNLLALHSIPDISIPFAKIAYIRENLAA